MSYAQLETGGMEIQVLHCVTGSPITNARTKGMLIHMHMNVVRISYFLWLSVQLKRQSTRVETAG